MKKKNRKKISTVISNLINTVPMAKFTADDITEFFSNYDGHTVYCVTNTEGYCNMIFKELMTVFDFDYVLIDENDTKELECDYIKIRKLKFEMKSVIFFKHYEYDEIPF
jgi:hypothetical protein